MHKFILSFIISCFFLSCSDDASNNPRKHPTSDNIINRDSIDYIIHNEFKEVRGIDIDKKTVIGVSEGDFNYMFGRIIDLEIDNENRLYVLEGEFNEVRVYDNNGKYINKISKSGNGPGELTRGFDLSINNEYLFITDNNFEVEVFKKNKSSSYFEYLKNMKLDYIPYHIASCEDFVFISGLASYTNREDMNLSKNIHVYDIETGKYLSSFEDSYKSNSILASVQLTKNKIVCNESSETVIVVNYYLPYIKGYTYDGKLKWIVKLNDYNSKDLKEQTDEYGRLSFTIKNKTNGLSDNLGSVISFKDNLVIIQIIRLDRKNDELINSTILSYMINSSNGKGGLISNSIPLLKAINPAGDILGGIIYEGFIPLISVYNINR